MKSPILAIAMGYLDDTLISEAISFRPASRKSRSKGFRYAVAAACLCLILAGSFLLGPYPSWTKHQADDPNWHLTHYKTSLRSDIVSLCGMDLLLDRMALADCSFREYELEIVEDGAFDNPEDWKSLSINVNYGNKILNPNGDNLFCYISFDGSVNGVYIMDFLNNAETTEIGGHDVEYVEMSLDEAAANGIKLPTSLTYSGWAKFTYNGYTYYMATQSNNPLFLELTLKMMLS